MGEGLVLCIAKAHSLIFHLQHDGRHEQVREDARLWMDEHGGGRCTCRRCVSDSRIFRERAAEHNS